MLDRDFKATTIIIFTGLEKRMETSCHRDKRVKKKSVRDEECSNGDEK